ncbi:MAG: 3-dehydroquinate synthase [Bifidobacteriaceae bacterium]|nr:3-dehydroquinate synthase [Bifidobacteriaceae bacterium]
MNWGNEARIEVPLEPPYEVVVRPDLLRDLGAHVPAGVKRLMLMFDPAVAGPVPGLVDSLRKDGFDVYLLAVPSGEAAKTIDVAAAAWQRLGEASFTRTDLIVALGGGATTDLAGFVAATWLRGTPVVHVPTTLLAMVDAAIGGKTAIDTDEGKNLVGAFHQPYAVLCDPVLLNSLPEAELISGMAEVIKAGLIADPGILDVVWSGPRETLNLSGPLLTELIRRAVAVKAEVVGEDPHESGRRAVLNYGHTFGHAIEQVEHFEWRHGDAVAVGMVFAAETAVRAGLMEPSLLGLHRELLSAVGLPTSYRPGRWDRLWPAMRRDKKNQGDVRRMVLLEDVAKPVIVRGIPEAILEEAYQAISAVPGAAPYPTADGPARPLDNPYGLPAYIPPLAGAEPDELLAGREPDELLAGREPDELLAGPEPDGPLAGREPDELLAGREPDELLAGREPDELLAGPEPDGPLDGREPDELLAGREPDGPLAGAPSFDEPPERYPWEPT